MTNTVIRRTILFILLVWYLCSCSDLTPRGKKTLRESGYGSDKCHQKKQFEPQLFKI